MDRWIIVGAVAALLTSLSFVPQVVRMWRSRSVRDISPVMLAQFAVGLSLWAVYGFHLKDPIIVTANLFTLATVLVGIALYLRFAPR